MEAEHEDLQKARFLYRRGLYTELQITRPAFPGGLFLGCSTLRDITSLYRPYANQIGHNKFKAMKNNAGIGEVIVSTCIRNMYVNIEMSIIHMYLQRNARC